MKKKDNVVIGLFILCVIVGIYLVNLVFSNDYYMYSSDGITYDNAKVIEVVSETLTPSEDYIGKYTGTQTIVVEFTSGNQKDEQIEISNSLSLTHNIYVQVGDKIIIKSDIPESGNAYYSVYNYNRVSGLIMIAFIFIISMVGVAKLKGIKSVIGLGVSLYIIGGFLLPSIYRGWSPILMAIISIFFITTISLSLLNGFTEKTFTAVASTMIGVGISVVFYFVLQNFLNLSGYNMSEADELIIISRSTNLVIKEVFFVAVLISSLGAVIDTTMSIASSIYEIRSVNKNLTKTELIKSGISIGQDMIGTMCQTLILAFVGSAIATLLVFISYGTQINQFLNSDYIALEIVQAISGSMAIIFAVPITAYLCTISYTPNSKNHK